MPAVELCRLDDIADGQGRVFPSPGNTNAGGIIVVRRGSRAWAYVNNCPHNHIPLDALHPRVVTPDGAWILCSTHEAVFRFEDGYCEDGPCRGRRLEPVAIVLTGACIRVDPAPDAGA